jgi:PIN domain nuclease of toxin-antitoxin system
MSAALLLDSHALLWALHDPARLKPGAVRAISDPRREVFYSAASAWELEIKAARGKLSLPNEWLAAAEATGFRHLSITAGEARASTRLPWHHADPFDRLLVAQAREHGLVIATRDDVFARYEVETLTV